MKTYRTMLMNLSIRAKLEIFVVFLLAAISAFIYLYFPWKFEKQAIESLEQRAQGIADITAYSVSSALFFQDLESAGESLIALDSNAEITLVAITDEAGNVFYSSPQDTLHISASLLDPGHIDIRDDMLQLVTPIYHNNYMIGSLILGFTLNNIRMTVKESKRSIALISIIIFIIGIFTTMIISKIITNPLHNMVQTVRQIESGDLTRRAEIGSGSEIDELAYSFNNMLDSLKASYDNLEAFNRNLEKRVKERTSQMNLEIEIRRQVEEDLLRAKEYAESLVDLTPIAIFSVDEKKRITSWNRKAAEITGYSPEEVIGKQCGHVLSYSCHDNCRIFPGNASDPNEAVVCKIIRKDGNEIILSKHAHRFYDSDNSIIGGIECFEDITYRKRLEEELQIRQRMDSLGNLVGGIAHDFNNLLMGIMGNLDMILIDPRGINDDYHEYVDESYRLSQRAAKLIKDIQNLTDGVLTQRTTFDLFDTASNVFSMLERTTDKLIEKKIDIEPGKHLVFANEDQIHQVLLNLGTNSVNALQERGVEAGDFIRIAADDVFIGENDVTGLPIGEYVHIMFQDNGKGMSESVRIHAFEPLFTTRQKCSKKGQGLGLAMAYNIVTKNHEGHITIDSRENIGTTVNIWLAKGKNEISGLNQVECIRTPNGRGTILLVEDEEPIRTVTEKILAANGYTIISAEDGIDGLEKFHRYLHDIDLVILDLTMPRMSGNMLFQHMIKTSPDMKVIISSGQSEDDLSQYTNLSGILRKPYPLPALLSVVKNSLDMQSSI